MILALGVIAYALGGSLFLGLVFYALGGLLLTDEDTMREEKIIEYKEAPLQKEIPKKYSNSHLPALLGMLLFEIIFTAFNWILSRCL